MRAAKIENDAEEHISGAEGIYNFSEVERLLKNFFRELLSIQMVCQIRLF